jgi:uncharacterized protein with PIN domain
MIKIVKYGHEKEFFARCLECATDFTYTLEDVKETAKEGETPPISEILAYPFVVCPVCGERVSASKLTREEAERIPAMPYFYPGWKA